MYETDFFLFHTDSIINTQIVSLTHR